MRSPAPLGVLEPEAEEARERLLNAYQAAIRVYADLQNLRPWAAGRRRELAGELEVLCELADEARDELAALGAGYVAPPRRLRDVLDDVGRHVYGGWTIGPGGRRVRA
jgi:hypothetical protein